MIQKNVSFYDFQRILTDTNGKPVYEELSDRFILEWLGGSFLYHSEVLFQDVFNSYEKEFKKKDPIEAIKLFKKKYLTDAYEALPLLPLEQDIPLLEAAFPVKEQPKQAYSFDYEGILANKRLSDFKTKSLELSSDQGKLVITGLLKNGKRETFLKLERK